MRNIFTYLLLAVPVFLYGQADPISVSVNPINQSGSNAYLKDVGFGLDKSATTVSIDPTEVDYWDWANFPVIDVKKYGAVGDSTTDDFDAFDDAFDAISGGGTLLIPEGTYRLSDDIVKTISGNIKIQCLGNVKIRTSISGTSEATRYLFRLSCDTLQRIVSENSLTMNDTVIVLNNHGLYKDDIFRLFNDSLYDESTKFGELHKVKRINGDSVFIYSKIQVNYNNFYIRKIKSYSVIMDGGEYIGPRDNYIKFQNVQLENFNNIRISNATFRDAQYSGLMLVSIYHGLVDNCEFSDAMDIGLGYGSMVNSCEGVTYYRCTAQNCSHAIAMGGGFPVRDITVDNCILYSKRGNRYPLENHPVAFNIRMINNTIYNGGIRIRGNNQVVEGNTIYPIEAGAGVYVQMSGVYSDYLTIRNNHIIDPAKNSATIGVGVYFYNTRPDTCRNVVIDGNLIDVNGYGIFVSRYNTSSDSGYIHNLYMTNNNINNDNGACIYLTNYNTYKNVFIKGGFLTNDIGVGVYVDSNDSIDIAIVDGVNISTTTTNNPIYLMSTVKTGVVKNNFVMGDIAQTDGIRLRARKSILRENQICNILNGGYIVNSECGEFWDINNIKVVAGDTTNSAGVSHIMEIE